MNPSGPELLDIHLPSTPSWWPPAPGWWVLACLVIAASVTLTLWWRRHARLRATRLLFEHELEALAERYPAATQAAARVAGLSVLLRRIVGLHAPHALTLQHEAWLRFLDGSDSTRPFSTGPGRILLDAPYRSNLPEHDAEILFELVRRKLPDWTRPGHA